MKTFKGPATGDRTLTSLLNLTIGEVPVHEALPFKGIGIAAGAAEASFGCRGPAADPIAAFAVARQIQDAAQRALQGWGGSLGSLELRVGLCDEPVPAAMLSPVPGGDAVWPYEVVIGRAPMAGLPPVQRRGKACSEKVAIGRVGPALRSDPAVSALLKDGVELTFRRLIGWLPEQQRAYVRFGVWRRDIDEAVALDAATAAAVVLALFAEMPVHRKTGITQTGAARRVRNAA